MKTDNFKAFGLSDNILDALRVLGYNKPTEVQDALIPVILNNEDVIVKAQTGSGKTAAFAIPLIEKTKWDQVLPQILVLVPTRELAKQVSDDIFQIGRLKRVKVETIVGRSEFDSQVKNLKQRVHCIVATPGRLMDHLEQQTIDLSAIQTVVLDEADEMLNMGFIEQVEAILKSIHHAHQTILCSATIPERLQPICDHLMNHPQRIEIQAKSKVQNRIRQLAMEVNDSQKQAVLLDWLIVENPRTCILFCNMKDTVDQLYYYLNDRGVSTRSLHGGMSQHQRSDAMNQFKKGDFRFLIATDVAARGLDIDNVECVVNVDIPFEADIYLHRIGRTARIDKSGSSLSLVNAKQRQRLERILSSTGNSCEWTYPPSKKMAEKARFAFDQLQSKKEKKTIKGSGFDSRIMKLHINAGKKMKVRASDIVGAISSLAGITAEDIGVIDILDYVIFVEILNEKGKQVLKALQTTPIKGKLRKVSRANQDD